jgi:hypothetical protein
MAGFEDAKQKGDWARAESSLKSALSLQQTEYAMHSLAWVYGRQSRLEEALDLSQIVVEKFGPQPMALMGLAGAALEIVDLEKAGDALRRAEAKQFMKGHGWVSDTLSAQAKTLKEMTSPAVYEISWTIPRAKWNEEGSPQRFMLPLERHRLQSFAFSVLGASKFTRMAGAPETVLEIVPNKGQDVQIKGKATLWPDVISRTVRKGLMQKPMKGAPLGPLFYHSEKIDPAYVPCVKLAKTLKAGSTWDTVQNIMDWRGANITYAQPPPGNTLEAILASNLGVCHHSSYLCASLARANGIDAVVVGGFVIPPDGEFKDVEGSHGWIEFKIPGYGWIEAESQDNRSLGRFMAGRHYLRYRAQSDTKPDLRDWISCQEFKVSGKRIQ